MKGLALDSGEFISADELNAKWLPRKATEEEMSKEQPEALPVRLAKRLCDSISTGHDWPNTDDELLRMQSAAELRRLHTENEVLRAQIGQGVPEIDYEALIAAAYNRDRKWAQGTNGCVAFKCGAEWFRSQMLASAPPAPQPAQANYLEMIYEYLISTAPAGYADEAFREVPEEVFAADSRNRISERRDSISQHTGQLPIALGQEEVGRRQAGCDVTPAHPAPQQKPLTDDEIRRIELTVHGYTRQPLDVKKFARAIEAAHNIGEKK